MTPHQIKSILDNHTQMRNNTCFQSAVEMVLKLYGIIDLDSYPEQSLTENDGNGFVPFKGTKRYGHTLISFDEKKFPKISDDALVFGKDLLQEGVYPIYSFGWNGGFHSFVGIPDQKEKIQFISKSARQAKLGKSYTDILPLQDVWPAQTKTEILAVRIVQASSCRK